MKTSPKHLKTYWNILDKKQFQNEILKKMKIINYNWLKKVSNWSMIESKRTFQMFNKN